MILDDPNGGFDVQGGHVYSDAGSYTVITTITSNDGRSAVASSTATIDDGSGGLGGFGGGGPLFNSILFGAGSPIQVGFTQPSYPVFEGGAVPVAFVAHPASGQTMPAAGINVTYSTSNGTAVAGQDYDSVHGNVTLTVANQPYTFYVLPDLYSQKQVALYC